MAREFTLTELQRTVEAISGRHLHKQNFRRLVETAALVEPTGETSTTTGGRPAGRFPFRREGLAERPPAGVRPGGRRGAALSSEEAGAGTEPRSRTSPGQRQSQAPWRAQ